VLIQDCTVDSTFGDVALQFATLFSDNQYYWFTERRFNSLFRLNKETLIATFVGLFPEEEIFKKNLYSSFSKCNDKFYFAPHAANAICEFAPATGMFRKIVFKPPVKASHEFYESVKFIKVVTLCNRVFFIPYYYPAIVCYDTELETLSYYDDWIEKIENIRTSEQYGYFTDCEVDNSRMILPCVCADAIVIFNTDTMLSEVWKTPSNNNEHKYSSVCSDNETHYFLSSGTTVVKRNMKFHNEAIEKISLPNINENVTSSKWPFFRLKSLEDSIWILPYEMPYSLEMKKFTLLFSYPHFFVKQRRNTANNNTFNSIKN